MNPKPASRRGGKPSGSVPIFPWVPAAIFFSASSGLVWLLFTLAVKPGQPIWDTPPASWMVLRVYHFDLRSLFTHHFLHLHWIHLTLNVMAILYAGRVLEVRWGSLRFSGFYLAAAVAGGLTAYLVGLCNVYGQRPDAPAPPEAVSLGASSAALACLTAYTLSVDDRPCLGCLSERYLIWAGMIVGAAGLVFLQEVTGANALFTPQLAGIATGAALHCALPWWAPSAWTAAGRRNVPKDSDSEIRTRVDQLLEKISRDGIQSLSYEERTFLRDASKHFRNR